MFYLFSYSQSRTFSLINQNFEIVPLKKFLKIMTYEMHFRPRPLELESGHYNPYHMDSIPWQVLVLNSLRDISAKAEMLQKATTRGI